MLTDEFRWHAVIDPEIEQDFLADVAGAFTVIPYGLSFGSGHSPFDDADARTLEQIATVGGLVAYVERHLARFRDQSAGRDV